MPTTVIELCGAAFRREGRKVFAGTHWRICAGEHWAVVGPNGSGKSTLLRGLWGGWPVCAGTLDYAFERTAAYQRHFYFATPEEAVTHVGFAEQRECIRRHLHFMQERWYSGAEHDAPTVAEFLSWEHIRGIIPFQVDAQPPDAVRYARWRASAIRLLRLAPLQERRLHLLSNGEWRRVLMARALMQAPAVLVLDDPFAGLDGEAQARLQQHLQHLFRGRRPVILAVSQLAQIPHGITHVLGVRHDRIVFQGRWPQSRRRVAALFETQPRRSCRAIPARGRRGETAEVVLQCRRVNITLGGRRIIRDLDWTVRAGEQWALLGPNGAGKSTLAGVIAGDVPQAYSQDIAFCGRPRDAGGDLWQHKHRIGFFAPELLAQFPEQLRVLDAVCSGHFDTLGLYQRCPAKVRAQARYWLAQVRLAAAARQPLCALSEGEQRLVLLARAFVKAPPLLILDEPFQNLDAAHRSRLWRSLAQLTARHPTTLLLITHRADDLPPTITHVLRLVRGRTVYCGRATDAQAALGLSLSARRAKG